MCLIAMTHDIDYGSKYQQLNSDTTRVSEFRGKLHKISLRAQQAIVLCSSTQRRSCVVTIVPVWHLKLSHLHGICQRGPDWQ